MTSRAPFRDRDEAARALARELSRFDGRDPVVLAIPRGGAPMGRVIADALHGELDVVLVRKLGAPGNPELAIGAVDERGHVVLNDYAPMIGASPRYVRETADEVRTMLAARRTRYTGARAATELRDRTVIVVDDGLATGSTMAAALQLVRTAGPAHLVCAVPVASIEALRKVSRLADEVVCLRAPDPFDYVAAHYVHFPQVTDAEVVAALRGIAGAETGGAVSIPSGTVRLQGDLTVPATARGLVVFAHGSGSSRKSPRNRQVAATLRDAGFATLLFDLLSETEDVEIAARFDVRRLATRLGHALDWVANRRDVGHLPIGLFGASTGSAAALVAAAEHPEDVRAVVSRGGRPDLAGIEVLRRVRAPTLLIVGAADPHVLDLNREALDALSCTARLDVVPDAGHLFEEPGTLEAVARHAVDWFTRHATLPAARVGTSHVDTAQDAPSHSLSDH